MFSVSSIYLHRQSSHLYNLSSGALFENVAAYFPFCMRHKYTEDKHKVFHHNVLSNGSVFFSWYQKSLDIRDTSILHYHMWLSDVCWAKLYEQMFFHIYDKIHLWFENGFNSCEFQASKHCKQISHIDDILVLFDVSSKCGFLIVCLHWAWLLDRLNSKYLENVFLENERLKTFLQYPLYTEGNQHCPTV